jgi:hypothetical protein
MALAQSAHMGFVQDGVLPRHPPLRRAAPGEGRIDHAGLHHKGGAVAVVESEVVAGFDPVAEQRRVPLDVADHLLGVGIDQQLAGIEAVTGRGLIRAVHAIAIDGAWPRVGQVAVPDLIGVLG